MSKACFSILAIFILFSFFGYCQFALSGGLVYGAPFSLNKQGYYTSSIGLQVGLNYALSNSRVYPSLNFGVNSIQLPLQTPYYNNIGVTADDLNCMLHLNYKKTENTNYYFVYYAGIGISRISPDQQVNADGNTTEYNLVDTGNMDIYPVIDIGVLFFKRLSAKIPLYVSFNADVAYTYMYTNDNKDYIENNQGSSYLPVKLEGNMLFPAVVISLNYIFNRQEYY